MPTKYISIVIFRRLEFWTYLQQHEDQEDRVIHGHNNYKNWTL
jgi:hypothetical protein